MSTSAGKKASAQAARKRPQRERGYVPTTALAKAVEFDREMMRVVFTDGRVLGVPLVWFPALRAATPAQRARYEIGGGGIGLHWPELDEDLSIAGLMAGVDWRGGGKERARTRPDPHTFSFSVPWGPTPLTGQKKK